MSLSPLPPGIIVPPYPPVVLPPPSPIWSPPPPPSGNNSTVAGLTIAFGVFIVVLFCIWKLSQENRDGSEAAAALAVRPRAPAPSSSVPVPQDPGDSDEQQLRRVRPRSDGDEGGPPQRVSPTVAGLPSFRYSRSVMHNATGGSGDEATTCSVCLGAFQTGETVRLLPVCLHLYHVECIDPWLDTHSTCPICRSGTDPTMDGRQYPPV